MREKLVEENPFQLVHLPKQEKRIPKFLYEKNLRNYSLFQTEVSRQGCAIRPCLSFFMRPE